MEIALCFCSREMAHVKKVKKILNVFVEKVFDIVVVEKTS